MIIAFGLMTKYVMLMIYVYGYIDKITFENFAITTS